MENRYQFQYWALELIGARTYSEKKKGKDRGVDGYADFIHGPRKIYAKCVVQVKSGKINSSMIRDLKGTIEREKAEMGVFITLEPSTSDMRKEALDAGYYFSEIMNRNYPRIQILTIEQLLTNPDCFLFPPRSVYHPSLRTLGNLKGQNGIF